MTRSLWFVLVLAFSATAQEERLWELRFDNADELSVRFHSLKDGMISFYPDVARERLLSVPVKRVAQGQPAADSPGLSGGQSWDAIVVLEDGSQVRGFFLGIWEGAVNIRWEKIGAIPFPAQRVKELRLLQHGQRVERPGETGRQPRPLTKERFYKLWRHLVSSDNLIVWDAAIEILGAGDNALPYLETELKVLPDSQERIMELIGQLAADAPNTRAEAARKIVSLKRLARRHLSAAQNSSNSPEVRRRLRALLNSTREENYSFDWSTVQTPDVLRVQRAVRILERMDTQRSHALITRVAAGPEGLATTSDARFVQARLEKR